MTVVTTVAAGIILFSKIGFMPQELCNNTGNNSFFIVE